MRVDLLQKVKALLSSDDNYRRIDLGISGISVDGTYYPNFNDHLGRLTNEPSYGIGGLAAWICFVAGEEYDLHVGNPYEELASYVLGASKAQAEILFATPADDEHTIGRGGLAAAIERIDRAIALVGVPEIEDLEALRLRLEIARDALKQAETASESLPWNVAVATPGGRESTVDDEICDAGVHVARALERLAREIRRSKQASARRSTVKA